MWKNDAWYYNISVNIPHEPVEIYALYNEITKNNATNKIRTFCQD